jgi:hypothetical protein
MKNPTSRTAVRINLALSSHIISHGLTCLPEIGWDASLPLFAHEHAIPGRGRGLAKVVARTRAPRAGFLAGPSVRLSFLLVPPNCSSDLHLQLVDDVVIAFQYEGVAWN